MPITTETTTREFKFTFDPKESPEEHESRWDAAVTALAAERLTIEGLGPDGDWPVRYEDEDGNALRSDLFLSGPKSYVEVYNTVPTGGR